MEPRASKHHTEDLNSDEPHLSDDEFPVVPFEFFVASFAGIPDAALPIAAARSGGIGLLNLTCLADQQLAGQAIEDLASVSAEQRGLILDLPLTEFELWALNRASQWEVIWLQDLLPDQDLKQAIDACRKIARRVGVIVSSAEAAARAVDAGADMLVVKGHEAGGFVGEETTFVLLQRLRSTLRIPLIAWGGIGANTAAACRIAGCAGVVFDWQFALLRESPLPTNVRRRLANADGSETLALPIDSGRYLRFFWQLGSQFKDELETLLAGAREKSASAISACRNFVSEQFRSADDGKFFRLVGQDIGFARHWAARATSVGRALQLLRSSIDRQVASACHAGVMNENGPLAQSHGTQFPIVQGPMTRVSDVSEFCEAVAEGGGLPFLALALMGEKQVRELMERTRDRLGDRAWGVGMLGFVPQEIRAQQWPVIEQVRPAYAIIAGGRPDQAASLEARGIATYLHVPSPGMLEMFLQEGARRFVFEGRECGGHVGPRSSFVLWEIMIRVLAEAPLSEEECRKVHILFAGGIHDACGAAMVAALAQPLVERGMKIGVLMGTAYLFTDEAVASGAIVPSFQSICLSTDRSVVVESGPGHAIRCANTDFVRVFNEEKQRLTSEKWPAEEVRTRLEHLNLGRLRVAAKGVARSSGKNGELMQLNSAEQVAQGMYMLGQVAALRESTCTIRKLHEEVCQGATSLLKKFRASPEPGDRSLPTARPLDLAIVGMSCLLPGADSVARLWNNVLTKHDPIGPIPADRFDSEQWYDPDRSTRDKICSKWGGFIPDVAFDPLKYGIPPAALKSIEPMQLLALELVSRALHDAGYDVHNPLRERTSVILGVGGGSGELGASYSFRALAPRFLKDPDESIWQQLPDWTEDSFAGILLNVVAGRISNRFDLGGMNCTVDAACASSLAAVYAACHELTSGNSDMVIVGGCDTIQNSMGYLCFSTAGALSPRGKARVFDVQADGIVISEGHGAVVLKRREDAERDGDKIYAILRGIAAGSDGRSKGMTAPRLEGQIRTLKRAYDTAGIAPTTVGLFEAHGTGTPVGDQTECLSLSTYLKSAGAQPQSAAIGSIKSSIGHTKCAAGVVGIIKTALALRHRVLPPTMHVNQPNPKSGFGDGPLYVNSETRPWIQVNGPRRAAVSSFGFGGTNFHAILEEYSAVDAHRAPTMRQQFTSEVFTFSSESEPGLLAAVKQFADPLAARMNSNIDTPLERIAYAHHLRQSSAPARQRLAVVATSASDLLIKLRTFVEAFGEDRKFAPIKSNGVHYTREPLGSDAPIVFLFPGQGSQSPNMLRDLAVEFREVADSFQQAERVLSAELGQSLCELIFPPPAFSDAETTHAVERLKATRFAQPALGVCGVAIWRLLAAFGVHPSFAAGHSFGELIALSCAGSISEESLYRLAAARGRAMTIGNHGNDGHSQRDAFGENQFHENGHSRNGSAEGGQSKNGHAGDGYTEAGHSRLPAAAVDNGQMLAVSADAATVLQFVSGIDDVWLANRNGRKQTVISGTSAGIATAAEVLKAAGIAARQLPVAAAFHSPLMKSAHLRFEADLQKTSFAAPRFAVFSNVTAEKYPSDDQTIRRLLADQILSEVRFVDEIQALYRDGGRIFIEVGPKSVLTGLVGDILSDRRHLAVNTQSSAGDGVTALLNALGQLFAHGLPVNFERLYANRTIEPLQVGAASAPIVHASHIWLVNGAYSRPASEPPRDPRPKASLAINESAIPRNESGSLSLGLAADRDLSVGSHISETLPLENGGYTELPSPLENGDGQMQQPNGFEYVSAMPHNGDSNSPSNSSQEIDVSRIITTNSHLDSDSMDLQAYAAFQATMRRFLETQENVARYLIGGTTFSKESQTLESPDITPVRQSTNKLNGAIAREVDRQAFTAAVSVAADRPSREVAASPELPNRNAAVAAAAVPIADRTGNREACKISLLEIVKDRTGYPIEMLDLNANLEADLGIDSIKRVEIISAFRRSQLTALPTPPANFVERLTAARSLQAILDCVEELRRNVSSELPNTEVAPKQPERAETARPPVSVAELQDQLIKIVAERTGYPAEMLNVDANLEADLGIDSIKRVEIIAAFRRAVLTDLNELPSSLMEQLTAAKTIRAIVDRIAAVQQQPAADAVRPSSDLLPVENKFARTAQADPAALLAMLVQIVADRTGYPAEMLNADAKLEADLGIDSIKRVEIIAAFRRAALPSMTEPPPGFIEQMTAAKSMQELVACVCQATSNDAPTAEPKSETLVAKSKGSSPNDGIPPSNGLQAEKKTTDDGTCPRCCAEAVESPFPSDLIKLSQGVVVITEDDRGLADALANELTASHQECVRISSHDLENREVIHAKIDAARRQHGQIAAIIHLSALANAPEFPGISLAQWKHRQDLELKGLLHLLQAIVPELASSEGSRVHVLGLTRGGGDFSTQPSNLEAAQPWRGGIAGMLKVAAKEWPRHLFRAIDLDAYPDAATVLHELVVEGPVEVGYRDGRRLSLIAKLSNAVQPSEAVDGPLSSQSVILVTAGAQGITAQIALEMASHVAARFILLGRSASPNEDESAATVGLNTDVQLRSAIVSLWKQGGKAPNITELERELGRIKSSRAIRSTLAKMAVLGAKAEYISCDVRNGDSVRAVVADVMARYGRIDALVHGAGVLRDQLIAEKASESFDQVVATKVDSLLNLLQVVNADQLKLVVLFASVSGFFGNTGQCDYAAANEILNRCARRLQTCTNTKIVALNWGPWSDVGMVTAEVAQKMQSNGVKLISPLAGRSAAWREITTQRQDGVRSILGHGPWIESAVFSHPHRSAAGVVNQLPFLADQHVQRHSDGSVAAKIRLIPRHQKLLSDHCIDGKPVLPLAGALELMVETAAVPNGSGYPIVVEDLRMLSGIVVDKHEREIVVRAEAKEQSDDSTGYRVQIVAPDSKRQLYQAMVRFSRRQSEAPNASDLPAITRRTEITAEQAYERYLFHGPTFRVIDEILRSDDDGIDAIALPSDASKYLAPDAGAWLIDPLVADAGPQLAMIWSQLFRDVVMLPTRVARYTAFAPIGSGPVELHLRIQDGKELNAYRADVWVIRDGIVLSHMQGLEGVGSSQLNRIITSRVR